MHAFIVDTVIKYSFGFINNRMHAELFLATVCFAAICLSIYGIFFRGSYIRPEERGAQSHSVEVIKSKYQKNLTR
jgi:hypothetical protein